MSKIIYRNVRPRFVAESLDNLHAVLPEKVKLPLMLYWGPQKEFYPSKFADLHSIYRAVILEGQEKDFREWLDKDTLIEIWPKLGFPEQIAEPWESRFPELKS